MKLRIPQCFGSAGQTSHLGAQNKPLLPVVVGYFQSVHLESAVGFEPADIKAAPIFCSIGCLQWNTYIPHVALQVRSMSLETLTLLLRHLEKVMFLWSG